MSAHVSRRVQRVKPSATLAVSARAAQLKAQGKDIISLGAGEPDFPTPPHIVEAASAALAKGYTKYTNVEGINELRDAISAKFERDNDIKYERSQILVSTGAKQTIFNLCMAVLDTGDEVIIPSPYWVSYPDMAMLADALPVTPDATAATGYKMTPRQLEAAITPATRLLLLNSPCNPTGAAYTRSELRALGEILLQHSRIIIGTDDIYEKIYWGAEPFCSLLNAVPELYSRTVTINGCSKAYSMTGWRLGYCGGPKEIITAMATIQGQSTSNASSIGQWAAVAALTGDQSCVAQMNEQFKKRHDFVVAGLNAVPGFSCLPGAGAFYAFPDVSKAMERLGMRDDNVFAEFLLNEAGVAVVAGSSFGAPGHVRISFATSMELLAKALDRMQKALAASAVAKSA